MRASARREVATMLSSELTWPAAAWMARAVFSTSMCIGKESGNCETRESEWIGQSPSGSLLLPATACEPSARG